ncbi:MFS transporter [Aureimonas sp. ME7]|uniref:MFS transporter n=1 Tax=Aureimonas sp. ME7 TaxID=2744252 RepID=UPI0015F6F6B9|nr:MFS transporter [Aureimonas sp. ME7]
MPASARSPWIPLLCGAVIVTIAMGLRQSFGLLLRPVEVDIGVGREAFGLAIALQNLLLGLGQPFVGALADRFGAGRIAAAGAALYAVSLVLASQAASALGLQMTLGTLLGFALTGVTFVVVLGAVGRFVPAEKRGLAFGIVTAGGSVGQFLLVPIMQIAIAEIGWRGALLAGAALSATIALLAIGIAGRPNAITAAKAGSPVPDAGLGAALREAGGHGGYWLLNVGFFVCGFHVAFIQTHLPAFLVDHGLDPSIGARALALVGLFNIFGSYVFGLSADRLRKKNVLAAIYFGRAVVIAAFLAVPFTPMSVTVFACAMGFLWLGTVPLTSGLVGQIFGVRYLSTLFGIVFMSHQIGAFFGAWAGGLLFEKTGSYDAVWMVSIALAVVAGLANLPIRDASLRRPAGAAA